MKYKEIFSFRSHPDIFPVLMWFTNATVSYVSLVLIGSSRSVLIVLLPLVYSDVLPPEQYARGVGFSMLFYGLIALILGPAIGKFRLTLQITSKF